MHFSPRQLVTAGIVCLIWIISISCHEFAHAITAYWGGDTSVKDKGYLTLNPFRYTSLEMTIILPAVFLLIGGFALPGAAVYIKTSALRNRFWNSAVSAAGPLATFLVTAVLAACFAQAKHIADDNLQIELIAASAMLVYFHCASVILNLLPVPGLDGYGIIEPWLPTALRQSLARLGNAGFGLILLLLWLPGPNRVLWDAAAAMSTKLGVPAQVGELGFVLLRSSIQVWAILIIVILYVFRRKQSA
ncbi:MAG TPA: site-2 protease family protein [Oculatellaceae cyanobacterium]